MFTFSCPACRKQHLVSGPFHGGYQTRCMRCDGPIRVTRKMVRVGKDGSIPFVVDVPVVPAPPVEPPARPPPPAADHPVAGGPPATPARSDAGAGPAPPAPGAQEPAADPAAPRPAARTRTRWRHWAFVGAAGTLFAAGVGVYLVAGSGKTGPGSRPRAPAAGGAGPSLAAHVSPTPKVPLMREPERSRPAPREVVAAALAADSGKLRHVRLVDAALHDQVLTLKGAVGSPALKAKVERVAVDAVGKAGLGTVVRVEDQLREPLEVVREAIARKFGKEVTVTRVRLEDGRLILEGRLTHWGDLQPAREYAVRALEEAGLGPITTWDNHLKKPMK